MPKEMVKIEVDAEVLKSLDWLSKKWRDASTGKPTDYNTVIGIMIQDATQTPVSIELEPSTLKALEFFGSKYPPDMSMAELVNHLIQVIWCQKYE